VITSSVDIGDNLPLTVPALLAEQASRRGNHVLLVCDGEELSYGEAEARSSVVAKGLLARGAGLGTRIGLLLPNSAEFVIGWLAASRIGAVTVPLSTFSTKRELSMLLRAADIEVLLAVPCFRGNDYVDALRSLAPGAELASPPLYTPSLPALRRVEFDLHGVATAGDAMDEGGLRAAETSVRPSDRLVVVHTSGSTGIPKGAMHQHGPLIRHLHNLNRMRGYSEDERLFSNSPFFWIGGFAYSLLGTLVAGATLVCSVSSDPVATLDLLERARPTMVNGFAASVASLPADPSFAGRDLTSIRRGNLWPILPADVRPRDPELRHNMLGMTEAGSVCLASDDEEDQPEARRGSFGRPVPGFETKIVQTGTGTTCKRNQVGELWLRGPFLMEGYYGVERHQSFTSDGWFPTGDLFRVDVEGFYYFCGRRGDMIKTAGANVSPREVETAITESTGLLAYVVGLDDPERGQVVAAALRVPSDRTAPDVGELQLALRQRLSAYKVPRRYLALADDEVPMLSSGKLDTAALRERFRDR
jgi:acyl-CoA synthetase (AMP-forming)/AMP-acid ligase II